MRLLDLQIVERGGSPNRPRERSLGHPAKAGRLGPHRGGDAGVWERDPQNL